MYVVDYSNNRIQKWLAGAAYGSTVAGRTDGVWGPNANEFDYPASVAIDSCANVYVADFINNRVQSWPYGSVAGTTIIGGGEVGNGLNQLDHPIGIVRDADTGAFYVSDSNNHRVMKHFPGPADGVVVAGGNGNGTATNQLNFPAGIYFDSRSNSLVIANRGANNIVRWVLGTTTWTLLAGDRNGMSGSSSILLNSPSTVTVGKTTDFKITVTRLQIKNIIMIGASV
ncbi:unnamed protein product, partial [Rotaria sordida]